MACVASQLIEEVTAHAQSDSLEDAREICADGTYFPNNLRTFLIFILILVCWTVGESINLMSLDVINHRLVFIKC